MGEIIVNMLINGEKYLLYYLQKTETFEHSFRKHLNSVYTFIWTLFTVIIWPLLNKTEKSVLFKIRIFSRLNILLKNKILGVELRKVSMRKIVEVLRLHLKLNLSLRQSATLLKISLGTASNYVNRFKELNIDIDKFISLNEYEQEKLFYCQTKC